jgi:hypothetical protein
MEDVMARTRHFQKRMSQRGITLDLVQLARQFGEPSQDKIVLGRKSLGRLLVAVRELERTTKKALDKGGIVVVEDGETLITTYRADSFDRRKAHRGARGSA